MKTQPKLRKSKAQKKLDALQAQRQEVTSLHVWRNAMSKGSRPAPPDTRELDAAIRDTKEKCGKAFWQRTQEQVARVLNMPAAKHRQYVEEAWLAGKKVPADVLADYPEFAALKQEGERRTR